MKKDQEEKDAEIAKLRQEKEGLLEIVSRLDSRLHKENAEKNEEREKANIDVLTGLPNRRAFIDQFEKFAVVKTTAEHEKRAKKESPPEPATYLYVDIDKFKEINDTYGHDIGDMVLRSTGEFLRGFGRNEDFVARLGGEEFGIMMFRARPADILKHMRDLEGNAAKARPENEGGLGFTIEIPSLKDGEEPIKRRITLSGGMVEISRGAKLEEISKETDDLLYKAKRPDEEGKGNYPGRNRIFMQKSSVTEEESS